MVSMPARQKRYLGTGAVLALVVVGGVLVSTFAFRGNHGAVGFCQEVAVPAYIDPTVPANQAELDRLVARAGDLGPVVLNPASGPGVTPNVPYASLVARLRYAGGVVYGYVDTAYAQRTPADVAGDVQRWSTWYHVSNIFFDQVSSHARDVDAYRAYIDPVHASGGRVVLNAGRAPDSDIAMLGDVTVMFEGSAEAYRAWHRPAYSTELSADRVWHLVYAARASELDSVLSLARQRGAGLVFVTDDTLPNPWDALPAYWDAQIQQIARGSQCASRRAS